MTDSGQSYCPDCVEFYNIIYSIKIQTLLMSRLPDEIKKKSSYFPFQIWALKTCNIARSFKLGQLIEEYHPYGKAYG